MASGREVWKMHTVRQGPDTQCNVASPLHPLYLFAPTLRVIFQSRSRITSFLLTAVLRAIVATRAAILDSRAFGHFWPRRTEELWSRALIGFAVSLHGKHGFDVSLQLAD